MYGNQDHQKNRADAGTPGNPDRMYHAAASEDEHGRFTGSIHGGQ
jgi:hypothetical protein